MIAAGPRGARRVEPAISELQRTADFESAESAGLFVGVGKFTYDETMADVPFAVDDAIDLAHLFAIELGLIRPSRVVLLLSGEARKKASQERLVALLAAGARQQPATLLTIYLQLRAQAQAAGSRGLLVVGFATHGYGVGTTHHLVAADSVIAIPETSVISDYVFDRIQRSPASRRLVFLDTCHERLEQVRGQGPSSLGRAASRQLAAAISRTNGQVIFSAARPGGYACENVERGNGVFTAAVIDGLRCQAETDHRGFVTIGALADYVNRTVTEWGERQRSSGSLCKGGIDVNLGGRAAKMPLAFCRKCPPPESQPSHVRAEEGVIEVFSETGEKLWMHRVSSSLVRAQVADLNGDCKKEVVVGADGQGPDVGKVEALDHQGKLLWSVQAPQKPISEESHDGELSVRALEVTDLLNDGRQQTVVLYYDPLNGSPPLLSILDSEGKLRSLLLFPSGTSPFPQDRSPYLDGFPADPRQ